MTSYTVERSTVVAAPAETIRRLIDDFHEWQQWSPWEDLDPDLKRAYGGTARGVGARYEWSGNRKAGAGTMEITESSPAGIALDLHFLKPFKSSSVQRMILTPQGDGSTEVTWHMDGEVTGVSGVLGRFMNFDKIVGPDFEKGLARLKGVAETAA